MSETNTSHHPFGPSSLARRDLCPSSYRLEKDLPEFETENANEGTRLHAEIASVIQKSIDKETVSVHDEKVSMMFSKYLEIIGNIESGFESHVEYPVQFKYAGVVQFTGTADVLMVLPEKVIVIDWKTGHRHVDEAGDNIQLAAYALAAMQMFGKDTAEVYIFNPTISQNCTATFHGKEPLARYITGVISKCKADNAPINPSEEACRYCKAAYYGTCPALAKTVEITAAKAEEFVPIPALSVLTVEYLCEAKRKCDLIAKFSERVDAELKRRCEANGSCGPWTIKEISGGREIKNINGAFVASGMTAEAFIEACSCSISKLEKAYAKSGKESGAFNTEKDAKADLNARLTEFIENKPNKKMLVMAKA